MAQPKIIKILRSAFGALILLKILYTLPSFKEWLFQDGYFPHQIFQNNPGFSYLHYTAADWPVVLTTLIICIASILMLIGRWAQLATVINFFAIMSLDHLNPMICNGVDRTIRVVLFYLCFASNTSTWPLKLIRFQVALIYMASFADKILYSSGWTDLIPIRLVFHWSQYRLISVPDFILYSAVPEALAFFTLVSEFLIGTLMFHRKYKFLILFSGIVLHAGIAIFTNIPLFSLTMLICYIAFIEEKDFKKFNFDYKKITATSIVFLIILTICATLPPPISPRRLNQEVEISLSKRNTSDTQQLLNFFKSREQINPQLIVLAAELKQTSIVQELLTRGIDANTKNLNSWTALHFAAYTNNLELIDLLLKNGANPFVTNSYHETPAHVAVWMGHMDAVKKFIHYRELFSIKAKNGETLLDYSKTRKNSAIEKFLKTIDINQKWK